MKKSSRNILIVAALVVIGGGALGSQALKKPEPVAVQKTVEVAKMDLNQVLITDGVVKLSESSHIFTENSGMIKERLVSKGDSVKKGQLLIKLDTSDLEEKLSQAKYQLLVDQDSLSDAKSSSNTVSKTSYEKALSSYNRAKADLEANQKLYNSGALSATELEQYKTKVESAYLEMVSAKDKLDTGNIQTEINKLNEKIKLDKLNIKNIEEDIQLSSIKAQADGTLVTFVDDSVAFVNAGTEVATVANLNTLEVESMISEYDISKVKIGQEAEVTTLGNDGKVYKAIVKEIEATGTTQNDEVLVKTTFVLTELDEQIKPNFTVSISIKTASKSGVLAVPYEAISKAEDGNYTVTIVNNDKSEEVKVTKGLETDLYVELVDAKLKEGDKLLVPSDKVDGTNQRQMGPGPGGM